MSRLKTLLSRAPNYIQRFGLVQGIRLLWTLEASAAEDPGRRLHIQVPGWPVPVQIRNIRSDRAIFWQCIVRDQYAFDHFPQAVLLRAEYQRMVAANEDVWVIDGGGNIGLSALWFAYALPAAKIVVVEPDGANLAVLRDNVAHLGARVVLVEGGLWHTSCSLRVTFREGGASGLRVEEVDASTAGALRAYSMADLWRQAGVHSAFIVKMDIEGSQREVFSGDTSWLGLTGMLMVELDDWQLPWAGTSRPVVSALSRYPMDYLLSGELLVCFRDTRLAAPGAKAWTPDAGAGSGPGL